MSQVIAIKEPSNGGKVTIDHSQPYAVAVTLQGSADFLFHRWNAEAVDEKAAAAKNSKAKKTDDVESYVYRDDAGFICIPGEYLRGAIVGAAKQMHTIVASLCTGCALCLAPCPVDCIRMLPLAQRQPLTFWLTRGAKREADAARQRFKNRNLRLERERQEKAARFLARAETGTAATDPKKALIAAAIERARLQKEQVKPQNVTDLSPETRASIAAIEARRVSPNHASDRAADRTAEGTNTPPAEEP